MNEVQSMGEIVQSIGIPALFFLLAAYALFKLIPEALAVWKDNKEAEIQRENKAAEDMQRYYDERNRSYTAQLDLMNKQAEQQNQLIGQATQVISRSNIVIESNTKAIEKNVEIHDKVIAALQLDLEATREVAKNLQAHEKTLMAHDERTQKVYTTVLRMSDKIDLKTEK